MSGILGLVGDGCRETKIAAVSRMLKAIHAQEDRKAAAAKAKEVVARLRAMKLKTAAELVEQKVAETLTCYATRARTGGRSERTIRACAAPLLPTARAPPPDHWLHGVRCTL